MMCITPFVALISAALTISPFTVTAPFVALIKRVSPWTVATSWEGPKSVDKTFPATIPYVNNSTTALLPSGRSKKANVASGRA